MKVGEEIVLRIVFVLDIYLQVRVLLTKLIRLINEFH